MELLETCSECVCVCAHEMMFVLSAVTAKDGATESMTKTPTHKTKQIEQKKTGAPKSIMMSKYLISLLTFTEVSWILLQNNIQ